MNSNLFRINFKDLTGAVLSGVIMAVLSYLGSLTNIFTVDWSAVLNISILAAITSLAKSFSTDNSGKFLGKIRVK